MKHEAFHTGCLYLLLCQCLASNTHRSTGRNVEALEDFARRQKRDLDPRVIQEWNRAKRTAEDSDENDRVAPTPAFLSGAPGEDAAGPCTRKRPEW